ncbi:hypothetical protein [Methanoregula sp.]|uniref:hypothetical protein n=1 Tax=Methanoregula sp. TaxID=2052170 RepID=UPI002621181C|nr:hypothetical protein [Methanoregula sp.]MDD5143151.1 hypothetical protein [Methanoregula sp.]
MKVVAFNGSARKDRNTPHLFLSAPFISSGYDRNSFLTAWLNRGRVPVQKKESAVVFRFSSCRAARNGRSDKTVARKCP